MNPRPIVVNGRALPVPAVCAPLVARTREALLGETKSVAAKRPDLLEWRVDFFEDIADARAVLDAAARIRALAGGIPVLFTRRSHREGGERISLEETRVVALYRAVCDQRAVELVDVELSGEDAHVREVREASRANGIGLVLSFHDFTGTPALGKLTELFSAAHRSGADVAKVAVMPKSTEDVLTLMQATLLASRTLPIPVISMAMGGLGALSRIAGGVFGSSLTFAVGDKPSAPGQIPIDDVRAALAILRRSGAG